jgi:hypothetical protein
MADNEYFAGNPRVQEVAQAIAVAQTPYTLKFFELINSPQGPWLQMLQRAYYEDRPRCHHLGGPGADAGDRCRVTRPARGAGLAPRRPTEQREANAGCAPDAGSSWASSTSPRRSPLCLPSPPGRSCR